MFHLKAGNPGPEAIFPIASNKNQIYHQFWENTKAIAHCPRAKIGDFLSQNQIYHLNCQEESF